MNAFDERRRFLFDFFGAAVLAASPARCMPRHLPRKPPAGRTLVLGVDKAAAAMAEVASGHLTGPLSSLVATRYGHGVADPVPDIEVIEAGHPVPDAASEMAARRMLSLAGELAPDKFRESSGDSIHN